MYTRKEIILSSQSKIRKQILLNAGLEFTIKSPDFSEEKLKLKLKKIKTSPEKIIEKLSQLKSRTEKEAYSIGCDQGLIFEKELYDKVNHLEEAKERLKILRGKTHKLYGVTTVNYKGKNIWCYKAESVLKMVDFSDDYLNQYIEIEKEHLLQSVGCYRLEGRGIQLFESIKGHYFDILGLPILPLLVFLRKEGVLKK